MGGMNLNRLAVIRVISLIVLLFNVVIDIRVIFFVDSSESFVAMGIAALALSCMGALMIWAVEQLPPSTPKPVSNRHKRSRFDRFTR